MGGVDKLDMLIACYRTRMRQRKWWWPIFSYLFDATVVNSWLLMRKIYPKDPNCSSLLSFRRYLALSFLKTYGVKSSKGLIHSSVIFEARYDKLNHLIEYHGSERRCGFCGKKSLFICSKCDIGLHPKFCFISYHTQP